MNRILVIVAHPDDESLGCAGSIAKWTSEGSEVRCLFVADGESARFSTIDLDSSEVQEKISARRTMASKAMSILGVREFKFLNFPDNRLDSVPLLDIVKEIERETLSYLPTIVVTQSAKDLNVDHQIVSRATLTAVRPTIESSVKQLLYFETPSSTEWNFSQAGYSFNPNFFSDISGHVESKLGALRAYSPEMRFHPHPRSQEAVTSLATWRGATAGYASAEAFEVGYIKA